MDAASNGQSDGELFMDPLEEEGMVVGVEGVGVPAPVSGSCGAGGGGGEP